MNRLIKIFLDKEGKEDAHFFIFSLLKNGEYLTIPSFYTIYLKAINLKVMTLIILLFTEECGDYLSPIIRIERILGKIYE